MIPTIAIIKACLVITRYNFGSISTYNFIDLYAWVELCRDIGHDHWTENGYLAARHGPDESHDTSPIWVMDVTISNCQLSGMLRYLFTAYIRLSCFIKAGLGPVPM